MGATVKQAVKLSSQPKRTLEERPGGPADARAKPEVVIIRARPAWKLIDLQEIRQYRDLFYFLTLRDIQIRYKQTVLGGLWAIIQPFMMMVVFSLFFGKLGKIPSDGVPYPIFSYAAMVPWMYFATAVSFASASLVANQSLVSKVYFPRVAVPMAAILSRLLDFVLAFAVLFVLMAYYGITPTSYVLLYPLIALVMVMAATGVGLWLAALGVRYRDIQYAVPFGVQLWMFLSPVAYAVSLVPGDLRWLYGLNPMAGVIEASRAALLGTVDFPWALLGISALVSLLLLLGGLVSFRRTERTFADVV